MFVNEENFDSSFNIDGRLKLHEEKKEENSWQANYILLIVSGLG